MLYTFPQGNRENNRAIEGRSKTFASMVLPPTLLEECDIPLDLLHHLLVELFPVAEEEENLEQDEHGARDEGLVEAVQEGGRPALEDAVADELDDPTGQVHGKGHLEC